MKFVVLIMILVVNGVAAETGNFDKVLLSYEKLHQSFYDNDAKSIKMSAQRLLSSIEVLKDERIVKTLNYSKKKLVFIVESDDLEESKKAFATLSQGLLVVLEKYAPNKKYARYYCPMEKKYWIQNISEREKVMNPYASATMPHCGEKK